MTGTCFLVNTLRAGLRYILTSISS